MDAAFWHQRWQDNELGFHEKQANALLVKHFSALGLQEGSRVFLPLCGKTRDIAWLLSQGYRVAGAELSTTAIERLFDELGREARRSPLGRLTHYGAAGIDIFAGDIFDLSERALGPVDAIYDRAALVALPEEMRHRYAAHLMAMTATAPQFLICFEYDQSQMDGPPFSVSGEEVRRHYGARYDLTRIASEVVAGGLKGRCAASETAWLLRPPKPSIG